jgi:hypothetical protein
MRQFNLEEYLKNPNQKVVTRDGRPVRIICTDRKHERPIIALIKEKDGTEETIHTYNTQGEFWANNEFSNLDLMFAPTKKEGWVNIFKINSTIITGEVYNTEKEAKSAVVSSFIYISTVKVEWEE